MTLRTTDFTDEIITAIKEGAVGVLRTDTLYGIVAHADNEAAVERMYAVKGRTPSKSPIVMIASIEQMYDEYDEETMKKIHEFWPGPNSLVLPSKKAPLWITRGNLSVAYRIPDDEKLREFLKKTGPLVVPSANPEGRLPAQNMAEAEAYFGDKIDFYVDGGHAVDAAPSKLFRLQDNGEWERLR